MLTYNVLFILTDDVNDNRKYPQPFCHTSQESRTKYDGISKRTLFKPHDKTKQRPNKEKITLKMAVVYHITCICGLCYIGESRRLIFNVNFAYTPSFMFFTQGVFTLNV